MEIERAANRALMNSPVRGPEQFTLFVGETGRARSPKSEYRLFCRKILFLFSHLRTGGGFCPQARE